MTAESGKRVLWVPAATGIMSVCAGFALMEYSIFSLSDYHLLGWALMQFGAGLGAYGFFGWRIRRRLGARR